MYISAYTVLICHVWISRPVVKVDENRLLGFVNITSNDSLALGSNAKTIPGQTEENIWTALLWTLCRTCWYSDIISVSACSRNASRTFIWVKFYVNVTIFGGNYLIIFFFSFLRVSPFRSFQSLFFKSIFIPYRGFIVVTAFFVPSEFSSSFQSLSFFPLCPYSAALFSVEAI